MRRMFRRVMLLPIFILLAGCQSAMPPLPALDAPTPPPLPPGAGREADADNIRWVRDAAEYRAAVVQVYRSATAHVEAAAATRSAGSWAVILDADETVISNLEYQLERARLGMGFSADSWNLWVRRREAVPLPGAAAFLRRVRELGGRIAIVTNRLQSECEDTASVFRRHELVYDAMLCRPARGPSDKNPRFTAVARGESPAGEGPLEVVAYIGDNILDFPGLNQAARDQGESAFTDFGVKFFLVPNPLYGSWQ